MHSYYIKKKVEGGGRIIQQKSGIVKNEQWLGKREEVRRHRIGMSSS